MSKKQLTTQDIINQFNEIYKLNKFDYSKSIYKSGSDKIIIRCIEHNNTFLQTPDGHKKAPGCKECGKLNRKLSKLKSIDEFKNQASIKYNNKFNYSKVNYTNCKDPIIIICPIHNEFTTTADIHLNKKGFGCTKCGRENSHKVKTKPLNKFKEDSNILHNYSYDYSNVKYINSNTTVEIICKKHNFSFYQTPGNHLAGQGCKKCTHIISHLETKWLDSLNISKENRNKYIKINDLGFYPDGFDPTINTIYEFYGDFYHGNPKIYKSEDINPKLNISYGELYKRTLEKERILKEAGYSIVSIWESDYKKQLKNK